MKKNRMMRLASGLLVAVLITTSMISGTFAKYVTTASASDTARVAKWGVEVAASGFLFGERYEKTTADNIIAEDTNTMTVASIHRTDKDSVVAPGTKNETGITFSITGKPEVAVKVDVAVTDALGENEQKDVFLKAGTYKDLTTGASVTTTGGEVDTEDEANDKFNFSKDYYPVQYTLEGKLTEGKTTLTGDLATVAAELEALSANYVKPNTDLGGNYGTYKLTWKWVYGEADQVTEDDKKDTLLGSLAADAGLQTKWVESASRFYPMAANQEYCNDISLKVAITVTQVD